MAESDQLSEVLAALEELSKSDVEIKKISLGVERVEKNSARSVGIQNSSVQLLTILSEGELEDIMKWLSPIEPRKRHQEIASKRLEGTGDWFDRTDDFQNWQNTSGVGSEA